MSLNKVMLIGRLGQDPELKNTPNGNAVCSFSMATSEKYKDKQGQQQEKTEWHRVEAWGKLAELCNQYLSKGRQVYIEGKIKTDMVEKDGDKKYFTKISALSVQFLGAQSDSGEPARKTATPEVVDRPDFASDDIPF